MTIRKRDLEGEIYIDSRHGPISEEALRWAGLPLEAGKGVYTGAFYVCSHCQYTVYLNPKRNRDREWCRYCDHYICDACGIEKKNGAQCVTHKQKVEELLELAERSGASIEKTNIIIPPQK